MEDHSTLSILSPSEFIMELQRRDRMILTDYTKIHKLYQEQYDTMLIEIAKERKNMYDEICECCGGRNNG